jgi:hypothetical protein
MQSTGIFVRCMGLFSNFSFCCTSVVERGFAIRRPAYCDAIGGGSIGMLRVRGIAEPMASLDFDSDGPQDAPATDRAIAPCETL